MNNKIFRRIVLISLCIILLVTTCQCARVTNVGRYVLDIVQFKNTYVRKVDNPNWAVKIELPGVTNFHKVSDDLYRGAQPTNEGMKELEKLGVKTIINLRSEHSDKEELQNTHLNYVNIPLTTDNPDIEDIVLFLKVINDSNNLPVFVHCRYGADRTGMMCAIYRVIEQNWTRQDAVEEMTKGGFGFHSIWTNLADYVKKMDIDKIKEKANLTKKPEKIAL